LATLTAQIDTLLSDPDRRAELGREAAATVRRSFTWEQCGRETVAAYHDALHSARAPYSV
jgi:teichuronic acid biosynthesis glycosyltransferase TuaC